MLSLQGVMVIAALLIVDASVSQGFWYYSSSSNQAPNPAKRLQGPPPPPPGVQPAYSLRSEAFPPWPNHPPPYMGDAAGMTVALPVAVSVQQQMGPPPPALRGTLHDVQLVPCLCPVSSVFKDYEPTASQGQPPQQTISYSQPSSSASNNP